MLWLLAETWIDAGDVLLLFLVTMGVAVATRLVLQQLASLEDESRQRNDDLRKELSILSGRIDRLEAFSRHSSSSHSPDAPPDPEQS